MVRTSLTLRASSSEVDLVTRLRAGDPRACEEFVRAHGGRMLAVARRLLKHHEDDAADAVQDAFISAFASIHRFEAGSEITTWLHRIVVNACLIKLRRARGQGGHGSIDPLMPTFDASGHH